MQPTIAQKEDKRLSFVFCYILFGIFLTNVSSVLRDVFPFPSDVVSTINKGIILMLLIFNVLLIAKRIRVEAILFCGALMLLLAINYLLNDSSSGFMQLLPEFLVTVLPVIVLTFCINDYDIFLEYLMKLSPLIIGLSFLTVFIKAGVKNEYYMGFANSLLIPVITTLYAFFYQNKKWMGVFSVAGTLVIIMLGARGSLLAIASFFLVILFKNVRNAKKSLASILVIVLLLVAIAFFQPIVEFLNNFLIARGFASRTLRLLLQDEIKMGGRDHIYATMLEGIRNNPLAIRGIGAEYIVTDTYAHNFFLEILYQFGIFFGGIAVLVLICYMCKTLFIAHKTSFEYILLIIFCVAIPIGLVSNTIWRAPYFWMWIVLCIKNSVNKYHSEFGGHR